MKEETLRSLSSVIALYHSEHYTHMGDTSRISYHIKKEVQLSLKTNLKSLRTKKRQKIVKANKPMYA